MSRARDIAIELFGEAQGQKMESADVYNALAKDAVSKLVSVELSVDNDPSTLPPLITNAIFGGALTGSTGSGSTTQLAYSIGYGAQIEDALTGEYSNLDSLADLYRANQDQS